MRNFTMPALSPTMTEGNIAKWNVKEGDSFAAGDVLLEIETDKASMDVEAQDDGIVAKIIMGDGSKGIKVGKRIGVLAEAGDDLSSLEIPAEESSAPPTPKEEASKPEPAKSSASQAEAPSTSKPSVETSAPAKKSSGKAKKQTYPLLPSVQHLIHERGLNASDIDKMIPSGPNNRLLKGDVLAYLGSISSSYPAELSQKIAKLSHLDLSNIKIAPPKASKPAKKDAPEPKPITFHPVAHRISMKAAVEVQQRIQSTLGVFIPLSTFIERAADIANDDLPRPKNYKPSSDELFDSVLGLDKITPVNGVRGNFLPQSRAALSQKAEAYLSKQNNNIDIYDLLAGVTRTAPVRRSVPKPEPVTEDTFSVNVPETDLEAASIFMQRFKLILEKEPGRLIL
ncbi:pyridoxine biosynthesis protein [Ciborinia camelliae]|nr:pyridoxine biosynthesis protein [Ciborinia camelliae]